MNEHPERDRMRQRAMVAGLVLGVLLAAFVEGWRRHMLEVGGEAAAITFLLVLVLGFPTSLVTLFVFSPLLLTTVPFVVLNGILLSGVVLNWALLGNLVGKWRARRLSAKMPAD